MFELNEIKLRNIKQIIKDNKLNYFQFISLLDELDGNRWKLSAKYNIKICDIVYLWKVYSEFAPHKALVDYLQNQIVAKSNNNKKIRKVA